MAASKVSKLIQAIKSALGISGSVPPAIVGSVPHVATKPDPVAFDPLPIQPTVHSQPFVRADPDPTGTPPAKAERPMQILAPAENVVAAAKVKEGALHWTRSEAPERHIRVVQAVKPHIPLIKFKKGGPTHGKLAEAAPVQAASVTNASPIDDEGFAPLAASVATMWKPAGSTALEWFDTPVRFKRRHIDDRECDLINSGGCDRVYS